MYAPRHAGRQTHELRRRGVASIHRRPIPLCFSGHCAGFLGDVDIKIFIFIVGPDSRIQGSSRGHASAILAGSSLHLHHAATKSSRLLPHDTTRRVGATATLSSSYPPSHPPRARRWSPSPPPSDHRHVRIASSRARARRLEAFGE